MVEGAVIRPRRLARGDHIAAVTLSWGGPATFPDRYDAGKRQISEAFNVEILEMPHTLADPEFIARHPEARADDLMQAFTDSSIAGIISTIGGDDSIRILPFIDLDTIRDNPKVFLGYSDTTVTHMACLRAGLVSFYGPSIMAGFAENGGISSYLADGVRRVLFSSEPVEWPENSHGWTAEHLDWADPSNQAQPRRLQSSVGWHWLQGQHLAQGPLAPDLQRERSRSVPAPVMTTRTHVKMAATLLQ